MELEEAVDEFSSKDYGIHYLIIYPDLITLREFYSYYIQKNIEEKNEVVQIAPFYETEDSVRETLSKGHRAIKDIEKLENEKSLIIVDSFKKYLQNKKDVKSNYNDLKRLIEDSKRMNKNGVTVFSDLGAFLFNGRAQDLVEYELFLPTQFDINLKGFCLYHKDDFNKLTYEQKQNLAKHHGMNIEIKSYC
jgi:hypothetical protein